MNNNVSPEPSPQTWNNAVEDAKNVRSKSLEIGKGELAKVFAPELNKIYAKLSSTETGISADDVVELIGELEEENGIKKEEEHNYNPVISIPTPRKSFEETKKLIENFREKTAKYPKYISYEGSAVLCVLLSLSPKATTCITGLPSSDQKIISSLLPEKYLANCSNFEVKFDDQKDFILIFTADDETIYELSIFNSVIHPHPTRENVSGWQVQVENKGEKISVGGLVLDKKGIQKMIGVEPTQKNNNNNDLPAKRQSVVGRNAFELRTDIMQMAMDYSTTNKNPMTPEEIVDVAKVFYGFVENRHR